jgi:hypothetical protein
MAATRPDDVRAYGRALPRRFDSAVAHPARVYNVWIGGKDHSAADRQAAEEVARCRPHVEAGARANRAFLARAVRYLAAERHIRQFLDIGPGLPAPGNAHEVAQAIAPDSRVVYVDNDPVVVSRARAQLVSAPEGVCGYFEADLRDPELVVWEAARTLDMTQPVGLLLVAVLHFVPDTDDPAGIVAALLNGLAPGSFVAISHLTADFAPDQVLPGVAAYNSMVPVGLTARTRAQVDKLFGNLPLVAPGVVPVSRWRPAIDCEASAIADVYAGLAVTPGAGHSSRGKQ